MHTVRFGQVPEDEREVYMKGQHLRGVDATLAEQTRAEIVSQPLIAKLAASLMRIIHGDDCMLSMQCPSILTHQSRCYLTELRSSSGIMLEPSTWLLR